MSEWPERKILTEHHVLLLPLGTSPSTVRSEQIRIVSVIAQNAHDARWSTPVQDVVRAGGVWVADVTLAGSQSAIVTQARAAALDALDAADGLPADLRGARQRVRRF